MFSTSSKIAFGYIVLIGLLLGSVKYIYKQMSLLSERTKLESSINDRRQTTHKIISKLYEIEIIGQTLHSSKSSGYREFSRKMKEVQLAIDTLQTQLTDSLQTHRLDTLRALLRYKSNNMKAVTKALQRTPTDEIYQQQFDSLLTQQDSLLNSTHVRRRVITHHNTYTIHNKPKGFFKRIANVFAPGKADSVEVNNVIQEVVVDTVEEAYNPIDTIASMLTDIQSKVLETRQKEIRNIDAHINRLRMAGNDLSRRVNQLLETIEYEEQEAAHRKLVQEREIRNHAAQTMAAISIIAVILVLVFFTIIWHDLTKSNHYRRELEKAKLYAENLLLAREKLMLTITHDIKAPAGAIIGYLDLLNRLVKDKRQLFYLNNMQSAAQHLLNLVTSLLDYHRLEAGKMDLNLVSFKPYQLLEDIYHCFIPLANKKGIELQLQPDLGKDLTLEGDPFRLRQIIENLLSNALKFTEQGNITIQSFYQGNQFVIRVSDTGCGMTQEEQLRIFTEFTRLHSAQGQEGFGLGLSITRKLIDLLQGKIQVHSIPRAGSCFEVSIPLPSFREKSSSTLVKSKDDTKLSVTQPLRLLVIDDDHIQLQLTRTLLHRALNPDDLDKKRPEVEICCCEHPEEVISLLEEDGDNFDVLFTDIQMPAMNGFELLKASRELPNKKGNKLAVVAITARGDIDEEGFINKGFAGMLQKPFNLSDLHKVLLKVLHDKVELVPNNLQGNETEAIQPSQEPSVTISKRQEDVTKGTQHSIQFDALLTFTEGDEEAATEILTTLMQETTRHITLIQQSLAQTDFIKLCEIAHKMLPTFTMIEAGESVKALQWLENKRNQVISPEDATEKARIILADAQAVVDEITKRCIKK